MRRTFVLGVLVGVWVLQAAAQVQPTASVTVGIWADSVATTQPPASSVTYPASAVTCGQAKRAQPPNLVNPTEAAYDDPANVSLDCVVSVAPQITALAPGMYRTAVMANGALTPSAWGPLSDPFERRLGPPLTPSKARMR